MLGKRQVAQVFSMGFVVVVITMGAVMGQEPQGMEVEALYLPS